MPEKMRKKVKKPQIEYCSHIEGVRKIKLPAIFKSWNEVAQTINGFSQNNCLG
jgi:hypothetical protein